MSSCTLEFWWGTAAESINVVSQRSTSVYKRLQASTSGDYRHLPYRTRLHGAESGLWCSGAEVSSCTLCLAGASRVHSWALGHVVEIELVYYLVEIRKDNIPTISNHKLTGGSQQGKKEIS
ncbi:hypothetical protein YC2023_051360 [Brassica napus]